MVIDSEVGFSDEEDEEDFGMFKNVMVVFVEKDFEFYKFLKENDLEVFDFDENVLFDEVDEFSGSDEEDE